MAKHIGEHDRLRCSLEPLCYLHIKEMFSGLSMLLAVSEHNMQLERALGECRREYNILIDAILNYQEGFLQPHIITPVQIVRQMKARQADIPSELTLAISLSVTHHNLSVNIIDLDVFIRNNFLVYVIRLSLTNHIVYNVYHVLPLPIRVKDTDTRFTFILPERTCWTLLSDITLD